MPAAVLVSSPGLPRGNRSAVTDRNLRAPNGYRFLLYLLVAVILAGMPAASNNAAYAVLGGFVLALLGLFIVFLGLPGLTILQPNESLVCLLFGSYVGTEHRAGLWWINPFYTQKKVSRRLHTLECGPLKVNDAIGNPIDIAAVVVWRVDDAAKAVLEVASYDVYVKAQSETALRRMASTHPYDNIEIEEAVWQDETMASGEAVIRKPIPIMTLRDGGDEVGESLMRELGSRMRPIGIAVDEARISHLAYSSEIASTMLRRQAAGAVVAARRLVVKGAVSIVEEALKELDKKGISEGLDSERKAAMISNLLVVLVSDHEVTPIINTGTLYS
jgi:regulator of protease activity HflC (stomatin/prohibitin superfamily)